jgi:hypothetical protein
MATMRPLFAASLESLEPFPPTPIHANRISSKADLLALADTPPATQYPAPSAVVDWRKRRRFVFFISTQRDDGKERKAGSVIDPARQVSLTYTRLVENSICREKSEDIDSAKFSHERVEHLSISRLAQ